MSSEPTTQDHFAKLQAYLASIEEAHEETTTAAQQAYVDLLVSMAPPRTGPAPRPDAHTLARPAEGEVPEPARVLEILKAAGKTPENLRADTKTLVAFREKADLLARVPDVHAKQDKLRARLKKETARFERIKKKFASISVDLQSDLHGCYLEFERAADARSQLQWGQYVNQQIEFDRRAARARPSCYVSDPERNARERAAREEQTRAHKEARAGAERLEYLVQAFFPPPPPPDEPPRQVAAEWLYHPPRD